MILIFIFVTYIFQIFIFRFGRYFSYIYLIKLWVFINRRIFIFNFFNIYFFTSISYLEIYKWILFDCVDISLRFEISSITNLITFIICLISSCILFYSFEYIKYDPHLNRFFFLMSLFTFFILVIVNSANLIVFFMGWEGIGLCSYLLISFWYTRVKAVQAGLKALIINKFGDIFLLRRIIISFLFFGTTNFSTIQNLSIYIKNATFCILSTNILRIERLAVCFLIRRIRKSAQIGFHSWLTDAIEGPTPVSALLHAATIVTAGVFLVLRCYWVFEIRVFRKSCIFWIACFTLLITGIFAILEYDLKKIVAISTCNHLRLIFLIRSLSFYNLCFFHLINHAFIKAILFLGRGINIHKIKDEQNIYKITNLKNIRPFNFLCIILRTVSLIGFPFFCVFYSKENFILSLLTSIHLNRNFLRYLIFSCTVYLSVLYSYKIRLPFQKQPFLVNTPRILYFKTGKLSIYYICSLLILLISGCCITLFSYNSFLFNNSYIVSRNYNEAYNLIISEFLPFWIKRLPFRGILGGTIVSVYTYTDSLKKQTEYNWYTDFLNNFVRNKFFNFSLDTLKLLDKGFFNFFITIIIKLVKKRSYFITRSYTGQIYNYFFILFYFIIVFTTLFYTRHNMVICL